MEVAMKAWIEVEDQIELMAVNRMLAERRRQDRLFGQQRHDPAWWLVLMTKQLGQVGDMITQYRWGNREDGIKNAVKQSEQLAALAIAFAQCVHRADWSDEITTARPTDRRQLAKALDYGGEAMHADHDDDESEQRAALAKMAEQ